MRTSSRELGGRGEPFVIRVLQVLEATAGGTRRHLKELLTGLRSPEFAFHVACSVSRDPTFWDDIDGFRKLGIPVSVLPMTRRPSLVWDVIALRRLARLVRDVPFDVVHLHSARAGWFGRIVRFDGPVVYAPHAFPFLQRSALRLAYRLAERVLAPRTDVLHAVSQAEARLCAELGWFEPHRIRTLPNPLDVARLDASVGARREHRNAAEPRTFGLVADLRPQKAPFVFVKAARLALARGLRAQFVLPEHGPLLPRIKRWITRHRLGAAFHFIEAEESLHALYREIDVAVLPSLWEGMPYTLLETLALRIPVIVSDLPVFEETVGAIDPCGVFPANDAAALSDAMRRFGELPWCALEKIGDRGRDYVLEHHRPVVWKKELAELYRELGASPHRDPLPCAACR